MDIEYRECNHCGERWVDNGDDECIFCSSSDTFVNTSEDD